MRRHRLWPSRGAVMIRNRLSPSVSLIAFTAALACTEPSEPARGEAVELGSTGQALSRGDDRRDARGHQPLKHHHPGRCGHPPEPEPEPVTFTPATAAARSG